MPYRRLPNTDQARIRALEKAIANEFTRNISELAISFKIINEAKSFLRRFITAHHQYETSLKAQANANKKYQAQVKVTRLYISHFIQVLNMTIIRNEIKKNVKELYGLDPESCVIPDLTTEAQLLEWGERIIKGEHERQKKGGVPIYNPTIAKVSVHFDIFKEMQFNQKNYQQSTARCLDRLSSMRNQADEIILEIWNQVENAFQHLPMKSKIDQCKEYGVIYYLRKKEQAQELEKKRQQKLAFDD